METATALLAEKRTDLLKVDPRAIDIVEGFNVRIDYGDLGELASSILENGVRTPLLVRRDKDNPERFLVIEGHRRLSAIKMLFSDERFTDEMGVRVPVILEQKGSNDFDRLVDMAITNTGKPFTPIEFAELVKRLRAYGKSDTEIAKKLGKSVTTISNTTALLELPEDIKKSIGENKISANLVISVFKEEKDTDKASEIIRIAMQRARRRLLLYRQRKRKLQKLPLQRNKANTILWQYSRNLSKSLL
jgi:ParB/RepB/Spo0J family partition protein